MNRLIYFIPIIGFFIHSFKTIRDGETPPMWPLELLALFLWYNIQAQYILYLFHHSSIFR